MSVPVRLRLTLWYLLVLAVILAALGAFLITRLRSDLVGSVDRTLDTRAAQIALGFRGGGEGEFQDVSQSSLVGLPRSESGAQLISPAGHVLESSGDPVAAKALLDSSELARVMGGPRFVGTVHLGPDGEAFRALAIRLPHGRAGAVVVLSSLEDVDSSVRHLITLLLIAGPAALAAAAGGGWLLARKALVPVTRMTEKAEGIGHGRLSERVEVPATRDELGRLAVTLNGMLDRVERNVEGRKRLVADASHELRTPLAVMRSELEVALTSPMRSRDDRAVLVSTLEEVDRMSRIVDNLLTLARLDDGQLRLEREPVSLKEVVRGGVQASRVFAEEKSIALITEGDGTIAWGDRVRLEQVMKNLIENAVKYSGAGSEVRISVEEAEGRARVTVTDHGPGIPAEALPRVFDRFFRVDPSRSRNGGGSGLGLAICKEIVEAHGGTISVSSEVGKGSSFTIAVPEYARSENSQPG